MDVGETVFWTLMAILTPLSFVSFGLVAWWMVRQRGSDSDTDRIEAIWQKRALWSEDVCRQLIDRKIAAGMGPEMVELAWGKPRMVQPVTAGEQWSYSDASLGQAGNYVVFKDRQVVEVAGQPPQPRSRWGPWSVIVISLGISLLVTVIALVVVYLMR